jgi:hypothetical protein
MATEALADLVRKEQAFSGISYCSFNKFISKSSLINVGLIWSFLSVVAGVLP